MRKVVCFLSFFVLLFSCQQEVKETSSYPSLSDRIKDTTLMDTLEVGVWKDLTIAKSSPYVPNEMAEIDEQILPFTTSNFFPLEEPLELEHPIPTDTIYNVYPDTTEAVPFVSYVTYPPSVRAGDLRRSENATESIMYLDVDQGLPSSMVNCITEDENGNLWLGTDAGITRYDGNYFQTFTTKNGLLDDFIYDLKFDKKGRLWIGSKEGVTIFDGTKFLSFTEQNGLLGGSAFGFLEDQEGNYWFSCYGASLVKYDEEKFYHYTTDHGLYTNSHVVFEFDYLGRLFISNQYTVSNILDGDVLYGYHEGHSYFGSTMMACSFKSSNGELWMNSYNGGTVKIDKNGKCKKYVPKTGITYLSPTVLAEDAYGNLWQGTSDAGLSCMTEYGYYGYTINEGLTSNRISDLWLDSKGNMWVATQGGGLNKIVPNSFKSMTARDGITDKDITCLHVNHAGDLLFSGFADGAWTFTGEEIRRGFNGFKGSIIWTMNEDYFGNTIIGCHQYGTYLLVPNDSGKTGYKAVQNLAQKDIFSPFGIRDIDTDSEGNLWMVDDIHGLFCFYLNNEKTDYDSLVQYDVHSGLVQNAIFAIEIDKDDGIWVSYNGMGASYLLNGKIMHYNERNGLPSNTVYGMHFDSNNDLYFLTDKGLGIYKDDAFKVLSTEDGLSNNSVKSFLEDEKGRFWLGTANGLDLLTKNTEKESGFDIVSFGTGDGMNSPSFVRMGAVIDTNNRAWWITNKGLLSLNLNEFDKKTIKPLVHLLNIRLNDNHIDFSALQDSIQAGSDFRLGESQADLTEVKFSGIQDFYNLPLNLTLPYNLNGLTFYFGGFTGVSNSQVFYRYRLLGFDENWSSETNQPSAKFANLNPGEYSFEVQAKIQNSEWGEITTYSFKVLPPLWKTWWFRLLTLFVIMAMIVGYVKWRNRKLLLRQAELEKTVKERTKEIAHQKHLVEEKQNEILDSITYAQRIQKALLASDTLLKDNLPESFVFFEPKDIVSGDFYWATKLETGQFTLVTADSTGHGVPGAIMSMLNISCLEKAVESGKAYQPAEILNFTRKKIIETLAKDGSKEGGKDGMDCSIINFDLAQMRMFYAGANNGVYVIRKGEIIEFKVDKMPVGKHVHDQNSFNEEEFILEEGDMVYTFTDGFPDQFGGPNGKKFKYKQLKELLLKISAEPVNQQYELLAETFKEWKGDLEQIDDVCLIGVRI